MNTSEVKPENQSSIQKIEDATQESRTKLEIQLEALTSRHLEKSQQLAHSRSGLTSLSEKMSLEADNAKWEKLATQHASNTGRIAALVDEVALLAEKMRVTQVGIADIDLSEVQAEFCVLINERTSLRLQSDNLRDQFRALIAVRTSDMDNKQRILDIKTELGQVSLASELATRQFEACKRRRDGIVNRRNDLLNIPITPG